MDEGFFPAVHLDGQNELCRRGRGNAVAIGTSRAGPRCDDGAVLRYMAALQSRPRFLSCRAVHTRERQGTSAATEEGRTTGNRAL